MADAELYRRALHVSMQSAYVSYDQRLSYRSDTEVTDLLRYRFLHPLVSFLSLCDWDQLAHDAAKPLNIDLCIHDSSRQPNTKLTVLPTSVTEFYVYCKQNAADDIPLLSE